MYASEGFNGIAWNDDGSHIAVVGGKDHSLRIWNAQDGTLEKTWGFGEDAPWSVSWNCDRNSIAVGIAGYLRIIDVEC
jgi:WD40 repeat protein